MRKLLVIVLVSFLCIGSLAARGEFDPYEPNDTFAQAYGPLASGAVYEGYIESSDDLDYFYLQMPSSGLLEIMLDNVPSGQLWLLAVYDYRGDIEHLEYASSREVTHWDGYLSAGRYYVKIDPSYSDGSLSEPYRLWAFIPGVPTATLTRTPTMAPTWTPTNTVPPTETGVPTITATASPITPVRLMWLPIVVKPRATPTARPTLTGTPTITLTPTQTRTPVPTATRTPEPGWVQIVTEGFEGAFPTGLWYTSQESEEGNYTWGPRDCRPHTGIRSAWCVGAGADGSLLACGSEYPDEVETQLVYGPFDLRQATAAKLTFWTWSRTQYESDTVYWGASRDGWLFWGERDSGADDVWRYKEFDLSRVPEWGERTSYLGEPEVWIMFSFESDEWYARAEGWYIDDVQIVKREGGSYAPSQPDVPSETGVSKWRIAP